MKARWSILVVVALAVAGCSSADDAGPASEASPSPAEASTGAESSSGGEPTPTPRPDQVGGVALPVVVASVTRVADGDSFEASVDGVDERIRLIGINANERAECFGEEAGDELRRLIDGRDVDLVVPGGERDEFGRVLAYVYEGDVNLNEQLVRGGYVVSRDQSGHPFATEFEAAELRARGDQRGLWAPDACGPAVRTSVVIGAIQPNAPGPDPENPNGEWVELVNEGSEPADMSGWVVKDESTRHRYEFPDGFELSAGAAVRLSSGCGDETASDRHWCKVDDSVWNNSGDTVFLLDAAGNIVDAVAYTDE